MRLRAAGAVLLTACAPAYAHIYAPADGGDNTVVAAGGVHAVNETVAVNVPHQTQDYRGATWTDTRSGGADGSSRYSLRVRGNGDLGGSIGGKITYLDGSTNWDDWHYRSGLKVEKNNFVADRLTVTNEGDAVKVGVNGSQAGSNFRLSRSLIDGTHDDCFQNDEGLDGDVLEQNYLSHCYSGISARPSGTINASKHVMLLDRNIVNVEDNNACYKPSKYGCPNHAGWLKWDESSNGLKLAMWHNTFATSSYPEIGSLELNAPISTLGNGSSDNCFGNVIDWLGPTSGSEFNRAFADYMTWLPRCPDTVFNAGTTAQAHYLGVVAAWNAEHASDLG